MACYTCILKYEVSVLWKNGDIDGGISNDVDVNVDGDVGESIDNDSKPWTN